MKKTYISPEIEIKAFETEDIITASGMTTHTPAVDADDKGLEFDFSNDSF